MGTISDAELRVPVPMSPQRKRSAIYCALEEDRGIFHSGVVDVTLEIAPYRKRSSRGDVILAGFIQGSEIEVVFPGRRSTQAKPLLAAISRATLDAGSPDERTITIRASGAWRSRVVSKDDIVVSRVYQFLAAEWSMLDSTEGQRHGEPPKS